MPESKKQLRAAYAVVEGKSKIMPKKVAREMIAANPGGHGIPEVSRKSKRRR
jgi:hypothetical protein